MTPAESLHIGIFSSLYGSNKKCKIFFPCDQRVVPSGQLSTFGVGGNFENCDFRHFQNELFTRHIKIHTKSRRILEFTPFGPILTSFAITQRSGRGLIFAIFYRLFLKYCPLWGLQKPFYRPRSRQLLVESCLPYHKKEKKLPHLGRI